jgi:hypothetical protein
MYLSAGSPKKARTLSGSVFNLASAALANSASSPSLFTDARPRLSCLTFFQTTRRDSGCSSPRGLTADAIEIERVLPEPGTTRVFPTGAQVVPAW